MGSPHLVASSRIAADEKPTWPHSKSQLLALTPVASNVFRWRFIHTGKCMMSGEQSGKLSHVIVDFVPIMTCFNRRKRARADAGILFEALMSSSVTES